MPDPITQSHNNIASDQWREELRARLKMGRELPVNELTFHSGSFGTAGVLLLCVGILMPISAVVTLTLFGEITFAGIVGIVVAAGIGGCFAYLGATKLNVKSSLCVAESCVVYREFVLNVQTRKATIPKGRLNVKVEHVAGLRSTQTPRYTIWMRAPNGQRYRLAGNVVTDSVARNIEAEARKLLNANYM